ncbi:uncharacterized protein LOC144378134 [Ictidomys tridecemlineatus]
MAAGARATPASPFAPSSRKASSLGPRTARDHGRPHHARQPRPQAAARGRPSVGRARTGGCSPLSCTAPRRNSRTLRASREVAGNERKGAASPPDPPGQTRLPGRVARRREPGRAGPPHTRGGGGGGGGGPSARPLRGATP